MASRARISQAERKTREIRTGSGCKHDQLEFHNRMGLGRLLLKDIYKPQRREPEGIIRKEGYENLLNQLKEDISKIKGPDEEAWKNIVHASQEIYTEVARDLPDLMAYLDNLSWRPAGTIGWDTLYLPENDRGPDDAEHDWNGVFLIYDPQATVSNGFKEN